MIIRPYPEQRSEIIELERLRHDAPQHQRQQLDRELTIRRAGAKAEREAAYLIDFNFTKSKNTAVIHDLRLEINGRVAQIDHLLIHRTLNVFVLETKNFASGLKISEDGQFLRWNEFKKTFEGMPSPLEQNERHIAVLKEAFSAIAMPTRMGVRIYPSFTSLVLVSTNARIDRPKNFDTSSVIKADMLPKAVEGKLDNEGFFETVGSLARLVSSETLEGIAQQIASLHTQAPRNTLPSTVSRSDATAPVATTPAPVTTSADAEVTVCRHCSKPTIAIEYGKFGYYFKCSCGGNTPIKLGCGNDGHKERLRKQGNKFFRECADCNTSQLFFENP